MTSLPALFLLSLAASSYASAMPSAAARCFRTPAEAAAQRGAESEGGYRLESVRRDPLEPVMWSEVRSCAHPEQPSLLVGGAARTAQAGVRATALAGTIAAAVMRAGTHVVLVMSDASTRIEVGGTALANGVVGDRVKVRMDAVGSDGAAPVIEGVVRGAALVEAQQ